MKLGGPVVDQISNDIMCTKDVICSFASQGRDDYRKSLLRLIDSVKEHWHGDTLIYSPDHWLEEYKGVKIHKGWPQPKGIKSLTHSEMPYQFKTALIQEAIEKGYQRIIWLDSSMQLKKDLTPLFDGVNGMTFFENLGHPTWKYLSDHAHGLLKEGGFLEDIYFIPQVWGGAFSLDTIQIAANSFFNKLKEYSINGSFKNGHSNRPEFVTHRHDQAVMSVLLTEWEHTLLPYGQILCPPHDRTGEYGNDPYLVCRGV